MASASDHRAHAALQPADCLILLPQRLPAAVETSIGPAHYPAECTQSDAFLQPSLRARKGRANSNSFSCRCTSADTRKQVCDVGRMVHGRANLSVSVYVNNGTVYRLRGARSSGRVRKWTVGYR